MTTPPQDKAVEAVARAIWLEAAIFEGKEQAWREMSDDDRECYFRYARAAIAASSTADAERIKVLEEAQQAWDWLARNGNIELTCGPVDGDLSTSTWQVHRVNGGYNDREWTLIATGDTPLEAVLAALAKATQDSEDYCGIVQVEE